LSELLVTENNIDDSRAVDWRVRVNRSSNLFNSWLHKFSFRLASSYNWEASSTLTI